MAPAGGHVKTDIAQQIKLRFEALVGIALAKQVGDQFGALRDQLRFQVVPDTLDNLGVVRSEVHFLQGGVECDKIPPDPGVKSCCIFGHSLPPCGFERCPEPVVRITPRASNIV